MSGNRVIWKFRLNVGYTRVDIPSSARLLLINEQDGNVTLWAELDPHLPLTHRVFKVYGTGHEIYPGDEYVGTAFCGPFVWHVYEANK